MTLYQFNKDAQRRIADTVRRVEAMPRTSFPPPATPSRFVAAPVVAFAREDIEHDSFGTVALATGSDFDSSVVEDATNEFDNVYNPFLKIWDGARVLIMPCRLPDGEGNKYNIVQHFSATKIRGEAPGAGISAGSSAAIATADIVALNGEYSPGSNPTVYLETVNLSVGGNEVIWCDLTWHAGSGSSRWEVTSADCS